MTEKEVQLASLGYDSFFEQKRTQLELGEFPVARVISQTKGAYRVKGVAGEQRAQVPGKQMFKASSREEYPAVGDWVALSHSGEGVAIVQAVLPRRSVLKRRFGDRNRAGEKEEVQIIAANIDVAFVIESVDRDYNLNRFERYITIARDGGVLPAIILNKTDLLAPEELVELISEIRERFPLVDVLTTSVVQEKGLDELRAYILPGKTYCFLGSSGVGKSSLINTLLGTQSIETGEISSYSGRGTHTTTVRQMYFLENGGIVIDNPGVREVGLIDAEQGVSASFENILSLGGGCRYPDCTHMHEPGCVVRKAVEEGGIDEEQYENYRTLRKEAEHYDTSEHERRAAGRRFGRLKKTIQKK